MFFIEKYIKRLRQIARRQRDLEQILINQGKILSRDYSQKALDNLRQAEFKIFSQWGEDGIIQYLIANIDISNKTFVEFGVETFSEANCRFLMMNNYWRGAVIDGSKSNIDVIESSYFYYRYGLQARCSFITAENIEQIVNDFGFGVDLGILSIDIDGVDWHIMKALGRLRPAILIAEYNSLFGIDRAVTVPYESSFQRTKAHHSNLYYGASILALTDLAEEQGMALVAGNHAGNNIFFVRRDLLNEFVRPISVEEAYRSAWFAECRDEHGRLTYLRGEGRRDVIAELPLIDTRTGDRLLVRDL